ncbi:MAG: M56 family metallopeptidase [Candidatus Thermoplasmatota archaeon]|nr:M56 family metallopeptidase [Candidatus Thermoplasmatota archaeon]
MISTLVAIILSIVLTGIAFAIAETLAKLFHINHPKNMFSIYFLAMLTAFLVIPFSFMAISQPVPQSSIESIDSSICLSTEDDNQCIGAFDNCSSISSRITPINSLSNDTSLRYLLQISWYDFYIMNNNSLEQIPDLQLKGHLQNQTTENSSLPVSGFISLPNSWFFNGTLLLFFVVMGYILFSLLYVKKRFLKRLKAQPCTDATVLTIIQNIAEELQIRMPNVRIFSGSPNAFVIGYPSTLVFSKTLANCLTKKEFETTIRHELTHIKNHDNSLKTMLQATRILLFFNPFVHLLAKKMIKKRELLADSSYLVSKKEKVTFINALIKIAEYHKKRNHIVPLVASINSLALFSPKSSHPSLSERFSSLFELAKKKTALTILVSIIILASNASAVVFAQNMFNSTPQHLTELQDKDVTVEETYYSEDISYTTVYKNSSTYTGVLIQKTLYNIISFSSLSNRSTLRHIITQLLVDHYKASKHLAF